jgi:predicted nucleotidyltransferase
MPKKIYEYLFIQKLKALSFVDEIWLFGSRARGDNQERADIDIAVICPKANAKDWQKILEIIENADTLLKIDCLRFDKNTLEQTLYNNILNDKKVLYVKNKN